MEPNKFEIVASWKGQKIQLKVACSETIHDLKMQLQILTNIPTNRLKLIGLVRGNIPNDNTCIGELNIKPNHSFMVMGTADCQMLKEKSDQDAEIVNDLDIDYSTQTILPPFQDTINLQLLNKTIQKTEIYIINSSRPNNKLIVFDLDYTLFDCKSPASHISLLARPGMHEMLACVYENYEICIWSQTSWKWLEAKITELGMLDHPSYKIAFVLDQSAMFSIESTRSGKKNKHQVKPLDLIYAKFPRFSAENTVHVDDLSRNFAMNPQSVLMISNSGP